jgi:hypothetical protein
VNEPEREPTWTELVLWVLGIAAMVLLAWLYAHHAPG